MSLDRIIPTLKTGDEQLIFNEQATGFSLIDFWQWSVSDLLSNATRGRLAEFIVATAIGIDKTAVRDEWSAYDLETSDGIKIEVKSAAYIQSWFQRALSKISFSTKAALCWDNITNRQSKIKKRHADLYVFCLLNHMDEQSVDPLNLNHWEFYVLSTKELNNYTRSQHSITLKSLKNLCCPVLYNNLKGEITAKYLYAKEVADIQ